MIHRNLVGCQRYFIRRRLRVAGVVRAKDQVAGLGPGVIAYQQFAIAACITDTRMGHESAETFRVRRLQVEVETATGRVWHRLE